MNDSPDVTISIPTRNRAGLLKEALFSALAQDYLNLEVLISDNCSADETQESLSGITDPRVKMFRQATPLSMHENWNFCLQKARGRFFLLLSDDDLLLPGAVSALLVPFRDPEVRLAYSRCILVNHDGRTLGLTKDAPAMETGRDFIKASLEGQRQALPCITMHYTSEAVAAGGYPQVGNVTDLALRLALAAPGKVACVGRPLAKYRLNPVGLTSDLKKTLSSVKAFLKWADSTEGALRPWRREIRHYCSAWLSERACSSALRGERSAATRFAAEAERFEPGSAPAWLLLSFLSLGPVRYLAGLRRRVAAWFADRRSGIIGDRLWRL